MNARYAGLTNGSGPIPPDVVARIEAFLTDPCEDTWNCAYTLVIVGRPTTTFWQAIVAVDPAFPQRRPSARAWPRVPDFFTARRALEWARALHARVLEGRNP